MSKGQADRVDRVVEENLTALRKRRSVFQGLIARTKEFVNKGLATVSLSRLNVELSSLERNFEKYESYQIEIVSLEDVVTEDGDDRLNDMQETYATIKTALLDEIQRKSTNISLAVSGNQSFSPSTLVRRPLSYDNLPRLDLPVFDGKHPEDFQDFITTFDSLFDTNTSLNEIDKFRYLKSCLKDDAKDTISQFEITAENYKLAYTMVKNRFENKGLLVESRVSRMFNTCSTSDETASTMRRLLDEFKAQVRSLNSLVQNTGIADAILIHLALSKLSDTARVKWEELIGKTVPSWEMFEEFLEKYASVLEKMRITSGGMSDPKPKTGRSKHTTSMLLGENELEENPSSDEDDTKDDFCTY